MSVHQSINYGSWLPDVLTVFLFRSKLYCCALASQQFAYLVHLPVTLPYYYTQTRFEFYLESTAIL